MRKRSPLLHDLFTALFWASIAIIGGSAIFGAILFF